MKDRIPVHGIEETDVDLVEKIKRFGDEFHAQLLPQSEGPRQADIHGPEAVPDESISTIQTNAVIHAACVVVRVKPGELGETVRRLQGHDEAEQVVTKQIVAAGWPSEDGIAHKAVPGIIGGKRPFLPEVL